MLGNGEWKTKPHGAEYRQPWHKVHLGINAETKMHGLKRQDEKVVARRFDGQVAELQVRAALLNHFSILGHPCKVPVA